LPRLRIRWSLTSLPRTSSWSGASLSAETTLPLPLSYCCVKWWHGTNDEENTRSFGPLLHPSELGRRGRFITDRFNRNLDTW
jgi:hypothetical protein